MKLNSWIAALALLAALLFIAGRSWIALAYHALSYPTTGAGEATNVLIDGSIAYASLGATPHFVIKGKRPPVARLVFTKM